MKKWLLAGLGVALSGISLSALAAPPVGGPGQHRPGPGVHMPPPGHKVPGKLVVNPRYHQRPVVRQYKLVCRNGRSYRVRSINRQLCRPYGGVRHIVRVH